MVDLNIYSMVDLNNPFYLQYKPWLRNIKRLPVLQS